MTYKDWAKTFLCQGGYESSEVPDVDARIDQIVELAGSVPPVDQWERDGDRRLRDQHKRYLRGETRRTGKGPHRPRGEHLIEHNILTPDPKVTSTTSLGLPLVDGINAVPLAKDHVDRTRAGNVEADMLLLVGESSQLQLQLVEVKASSNNTWFAVVESLRQLLLFTRSNAAQEIMVDRNSALADQKLGVTGVVLAPRRFYEANGKKAKSVEPARRLINRAETELGLRCVLAVMWPEAGKEREITPFDP
jgi:hypothetical protein